MKKLAPAVSLALSLVAASACSDDRGRESGGDGGVFQADSGAGAPDASAPAGDAGSTRDPSCPAGAHWVTSVAGNVADETGAPSAGAKAQLCLRTAPTGTLICLRPADAEADGRFSITLPESSRCMSEATMRFVRPSEDRAVGYCHLDLAGRPEAVVVDAPYRIFSTARATTIPPLGDMAMERTVVFPGGVELDLIPAEFFPGAGDYTELAAAPISAASADDCVLAGEAPFDGILAFSPEGDLRGRAEVRLPNSSGLAANTALDVFVLGGLGCTLDDGTVLAEGRWAQLEGASVSADGQSITVTPGIPCLSWLAYRAR